MVISVFTSESHSSRDMREHTAATVFSKLLTHSADLPPHNRQLCSHFPSPSLAPYFSTHTACAHMLLPFPWASYDSTYLIFCLKLVFSQFSKVSALTQSSCTSELVERMQEDHRKAVGRREHCGTNVLLSGTDPLTDPYMSSQAVC